MTERTTVVIAEDSVLLRDGLVRLLELAGFEILAATPDADAFLAAVDEHRVVTQSSAVQRGRQPGGTAADHRDVVLVVGRTHYRRVWRPPV